MLFYLYPGLAEAQIIASEIKALRREPQFARLEADLITVLDQQSGWSGSDRST